MYVELWMILLPLSLLIVWWLISRAADEAFEQGIEYAVYHISEGNITYEKYQNEDGMDIIKIKYKDDGK